MDEWDVVIIGGGVAGLSAALVLSRARRKVLVLDGGEPRNRVTAHMHGVLGRDGSNPAQLLADGRAEVEHFGGVIESRQVQTIEPGFVIDGEMRARRVIIATGAIDELPEIDGLAKHWGADAVACPYCDGYEARDLRIAAMSAHQALLLAQWSDKVTLYAPPQDEVTAQRLTNLGIPHVTDPITRVLGERDHLEGIEVDGRVIEVDRIFVAAQFRPRDDLLRQLGAEFAPTPFGEGVVVSRWGATSVAGVWAVGNVSTMGALVPVAMGEGVAAATELNAGLTMESADRLATD